MLTSETKRDRQQLTSTPTTSTEVEDLVKRMIYASAPHPPPDLEALDMERCEATAMGGALGAGACGPALWEVPFSDPASLPPPPSFDSPDSTDYDDPQTATLAASATTAGGGMGATVRDGPLAAQRQATELPPLVDSSTYGRHSTAVSLHIQGRQSETTTTSSRSGTARTSGEESPTSPIKRHQAWTLPNDIQQAPVGGSDSGGGPVRERRNTLQQDADSLTRKMAQRSEQRRAMRRVPVSERASPADTRQVAACNSTASSGVAMSARDRQVRRASSLTPASAVPGNAIRRAASLGSSIPRAGTQQTVMQEARAMVEETMAELVRAVAEEQAVSALESTGRQPAPRRFSVSSRDEALGHSPAPAPHDPSLSEDAKEAHTEEAQADKKAAHKTERLLRARQGVERARGEAAGAAGKVRHEASSTGAAARLEAAAAQLAEVEAEVNEARAEIETAEKGHLRFRSTEEQHLQRVRNSAAPGAGTAAQCAEAARRAARERAEDEENMRRAQAKLKGAGERLRRSALELALCRPPSRASQLVSSPRLSEWELSGSPGRQEVRRREQTSERGTPTDSSSSRLTSTRQPLSSGAPGLQGELVLEIGPEKPSSSQSQEELECCSPPRGRYPRTSARAWYVSEEARATHTTQLASHLEGMENWDEGSGSDGDDDDMLHRV